MELKMLQKTCLERRGMLSLTQPVSAVVEVTIQKELLRRWTNPAHPGVGGVVGEKCDVVVISWC